MKLFKKVLSVTAALALVVTAVPANAKAASDVVDFENGSMVGFGYNYASDGVTVDGAEIDMSIVEYNGSKQLLVDIVNDDAIPKIAIDVAKLVGGDNISKIRKVEMDLTFVNPKEDGITDWVGGGIGANYGADGSKWYQNDVEQFSGGDWEKNYTEPIKATLTFIDDIFAFTDNAPGSKYLLQYWGNDKSNLMYIDNVKFLDADGNALPIVAADDVAATDDAAAEDAGEATPKTGETSYALYFVAGAAVMFAGAVVLKRRKSVEA